MIMNNRLTICLAVVKSATEMQQWDKKRQGSFASFPGSTSLACEGNIVQTIPDNHSYYW